MLPLKLFISCFVVFAILLMNSVKCAKLKDGECEVCIKFLQKFEVVLGKSDRSDKALLTKQFKKACGKAKNKENRFCYYIGGTEDAATSVLGDVIRQISFFKPVDSICEKLKKEDRQICELQYDKELDWKNINLKKMRVKELKKILGKWDETCNGCLEKSDYIKKIESVKSKHVEL